MCNWNIGVANWTCFEGQNTERLFGEYFMRVAEKSTKSRWFAHNGSKFDTFLLRYLVCERNAILKVIMNGFRILKLTYKNAEVLDSMLFCPTSLKNLVSMFDFGNNVKKGYYLYDYTDLNYEGPIPHKDFFTKKMNEKELKDFELWYDLKKKEKYIEKRSGRILQKRHIHFDQKFVEISQNHFEACENRSFV